MEDENNKLEKLVNILKDREPEFIIKGFAGWAYKSSIQRVLEKGGVGKFKEMAWGESAELERITSMEDFDTFHDDFVEKVARSIKTNKGESLTYGQAQKTVNVFLKVYVDRSGLPDRTRADLLGPWLHVPLDSYMMKYFYKEFPEYYNRYVHPIIEQLQIEYPDTRDRELLDLARVFGKKQYYAWQNLFRNLYPSRPVLLDMVYSLKANDNSIEL